MLKYVNDLFDIIVWGFFTILFLLILIGIGSALYYYQVKDMVRTLPLEDCALVGGTIYENKKGKQICVNGDEP